MMPYNAEAYQYCKERLCPVECGFKALSNRRAAAERCNSTVRRLGYVVLPVSSQM